MCACVCVCMYRRFVIYVCHIKTKRINRVQENLSMIFFNLTNKYALNGYMDSNIYVY